MRVDSTVSSKAAGLGVVVVVEIVLVHYPGQHDSYRETS